MPHLDIVVGTVRDTSFEALVSNSASDADDRKAQTNCKFKMVGLASGARTADE